MLPLRLTNFSHLSSLAAAGGLIAATHLGHIAEACPEDDKQERDSLTNLDTTTFGRWIRAHDASRPSATAWATASLSMMLARISLPLALADTLEPPLALTEEPESEMLPALPDPPVPPLEQIVKLQLANSSEAVTILLTAPVAAMLGVAALSMPDLKQLEQALETPGTMQNLSPWEATAAAFGLACLGAQPGPALIQSLTASLGQACSTPGLPLRDVAIRAWSLALMGAMSREEWERVLKSVTARQGYGFGSAAVEVDDMVATFLLHAAMLMAGGSSDPRASKADVEAELKQLPKKMSRKLMEQYDRLMPMAPTVLAHMLVVMHAISALPQLDASDGGGAAAAAAAIQLKSVLQAASGGSSLAAVAAAAGQPHELARTQRELDCSGRDADGARQRVLNEVTFLLQRRMGAGAGAGGPVVVSRDLDLVLPQPRIVLLVHGGAATGACKVFNVEAGNRALASLVSSHFRPAGGTLGPAPTKPVASSAGADVKSLADSAQELCACSRGVEEAAVRSARERGWRVLVLDTAQWKAMQTESQKIEMLSTLLLRGSET